MSIQKIGGWIMLVAGCFLFVGDFLADPDHINFAAFRHAVHESAFLFLLGFFALGQAESNKRILQLEKENAALRARAST